MDRCRGGGGISTQMKRKKITRPMKSRGKLEAVNKQKCYSSGGKRSE